MNNASARAAVVAVGGGGGCSPSLPSYGGGSITPGGGSSVDDSPVADLCVPNEPALGPTALHGVDWPSPYLHDGRAATLAERFTSIGGGDAHGHTSQLVPAQIDDLVAYLSTL